MDARDMLNVIIMGVALEREREQRRLMEESLRNGEFALREKELELLMLMGKKEGVLAGMKTREKLIDEFMVFIEAVENNDVEEVAQNFNEKAMMGAVVTMMNGAGSYGGNGGGFGGLYGGRSNDLEMAQNPDEAMMVATEGKGSDDGEGSDTDGKGGSCDGDGRE